MFDGLVGYLASVPHLLYTMIRPCPACLNLSFEGPRMILVTKSTLCSDCRECSVILEAFRKLAPEVLTLATNNTSFTIWRAKGRNHIELGLSSGSVVKSLQIFRDPDLPNPCPFMDVSVARVAPSALSPQCTELASKWLSDCLSSHETCKGFSSTGRGSMLPTRLIDIGDDDDDVRPPRLVISSDGSTGDYIALSHCWGGHQPLTTTTATLADRQAAIPLASMPLTFQHALLVTRKLGFRYIWIDSLCIIQDSRSDWEEQAAKMQHVYEGAVVTIAADAGNNSASGLTCADKRQRFRGVGLNGEAVRAAPAAMSGETPAHFAKSAAKGAAGQEDEGSALQTRGWTFQERVLARRVLHFGEYEMAWECAASIACECGGGRSGWKGWARHDTLYNARWCADAALLVQNGGASMDFSRRWMALVNKYSVRDLTYSSDKLVALAGLAAQMASCSAWDYLAGHWRQDLETTLLWTAGGIPLLAGGSRHADYQAPSWSWASVHGVDIFANMDAESQVTLEIVDASCTPRNAAHPFSAVQDGRLEVVGRTAPARVLERRDITATGCPVTTRVDLQRGPVKFMMAVRVEGEDTSLDSGTSTYPDVREFDEVDPRQNYLFLEVARKGQLIRGLILRPSSRALGAYERVGVHQHLGTQLNSQNIYPYTQLRVTIV